MRVVVAGATGCIGSRLVPALVAGGHRVTALARDPSAPRAAPLASAADVRVVEGDLLDPDPARLAAAFDGADVGVYLVHSMGKGSGYAAADRRAARAFARATSEAGVARLAYLSGLGGEEAAAGHLRSRREVESVLGADRYDHELTTVRAGVVVGPDSDSFRMMRQCVARLPAAVAPPSIRTRCQPVAVADVVDYLRAAVVDDALAGTTVEVGAPRPRPYADLLGAVADGLDTRFGVRVVPGLPTAVAAAGLATVTDLPYRTVAPLVGSMDVPAVVSTPGPRDRLDVEPTGLETAVADALEAPGSVP